MNSLDAGAAEHADHAQVAADLVDPVDRCRGILCHCGNQLLVVQVMSALHGVFHHQLHGILDAFRFLIGGPAGVQTACGAGGVSARHGHLFQDDDIRRAVLHGLNGRRHTGAAGSDDHDIGLKLFGCAFTAFCTFGCGSVRAGGDQGSCIAAGRRKRVRDRFLDAVA